MKKPNFKKIFMTGVIFVTSLSLLLSACDCTGFEGGKDSSEESSGKEPRHEDDTPVFEGLHKHSAPETDRYFIRDGLCEYRLVYSEEGGSEDLLKAREEFNNLFRMATNMTLSELTDTKDGEKLKHEPGQKFISLGKTSLLKSAGITAEYGELTADGYKIITKDDNIYIAGGEDKGTIYGVYGFFETMFHYDYYYRNCMEIDRNVKNLKLRNFNVTEKPDIEFRIPSYEATVSYANSVMRDYETNCGVDKSVVENMMYRLRLTAFPDVCMRVYRNYNYQGPFTYVHSSFNFINDRSEGFEKYGEKWLSDDGTQLCYTAHGDPEALEAMVEECARKLEFSLKKWPDRHNVTLTIQDGGGQCTCESCTKAKNEDGNSWAGSCIRLANRVMEKAVAWMDLPENAPYKRDLKMYIFAYNSTKDGPGVEDPDHPGRYIAANESVKCRDDVGVFFTYRGDTEIKECPYEGTYTNTNMKKWAAVTDNLWTWSYGSNFKNYCTYFDTFSFTNERSLQFMVKNGTKCFFLEGGGGYDEQTSFDMLKQYVYSKLFWNTNLKIKDLVNKYMNAMYGPAADTMHEILDKTREHMVTNVYSEINGDLAQADIMKGSRKWFPYKAYLEPMAERFEKALSEIEPLKKSDADLYTLVKSRINFEYIAVLYQILNHSSSPLMPYSLDKKKEYKAKALEILSIADFCTKEDGGSLREAIENI